MVINMFTSHFIKNNILYLEIDFNYEFGSFNKQNKSIINQINDYIKRNKINNKINKIIITCSSFIIGTIILFNNKVSEDSIKYVPSFKDEIVLIDKKEDEIKLINDEKIKINESITINNENNINNHENIQKNSNISKNNTTNNVENTSNNSITTPSVSESNIISLKRANNTVINIELEDYLVGVIASEMPASFNVEALKAQAVASRTYALKAKATGKVLTDTVSTQSYIDENEMRNKWGSSFDVYYNKIKNAVNDTKGEYLTYNNEYIEALYHSTNNDKTESSLDVFGNYYPYLISVSSEYDKSASSYLRTTNIDFNTISSKLGIPFNNESNIQVLSYTDGGNIKEINIDGKTFTGRQLRELLNLRSADFDIINENGIANITTRGFGHGVGLSQYGSNGMANAGYSYKDILFHYYPNTQLKK